MSNSPYVTAVVGAFQALVHSSSVGWILLGFLAVAIGSAIAFRDGSRVQNAEEQAALELLRR